MSRYVTLIWNPTDALQATTARALAAKIRSDHVEWADAVDCDGLLVLHSGDRDDSWKACTLAENNGVVLGKLFKHGEEASFPIKVRSLDSTASNTIIASEGRALVESYWGRYVAFIRDLHTCRSFVFRDPSGGVLCYTRSFNGVRLYFSHLSDVITLSSEGSSINWNYVLAEFLNKELTSESTGILEVEEVLAGQCHKIVDRFVTQEYYWNPADIVRRGILDDEDSAVRQLRRTAQGCINGWASSYSSVLHNLSGGLDSAIVLGLLAQAPEKPEITCLNYRTLTREGDERFYARLAATSWCCDLLERELPGYSTRLSLLVERMPILESPTIHMLDVPFEYMQMEIAKEHGVGAFTSGEGGDHLFYQLPMPIIAADYLRERGIDKECIGIALDTARLAKKSLWSTLGCAFEFGVFRRAWDPDSIFSTTLPGFIAAEALASVPEDLATHRWSEDVSGIPAGKQAQIFALPKVLHRHNSFGRAEAADVIHPLLSQPIVETCLRIPTYLLTKGGIDRGLARRAFKDLVPREIVARYSKGVTGSHLSRMLVENLGFIREFVLDGLFARQEFIKRQALDDLLTHSAIENADNLFPIAKLFSTEAWLSTLGS